MKHPYHFVIWINTSRGTYEQSIIFRKFGEKWGWGSRFYAYKGAKPSLIKKLHSPEFPADMMDADWDKI